MDPVATALSAVRAELDGVFDRIDPAVFDALCTELAEPGRRWFCTGQGRSGLSATMGAMRFMHLGMPAHVVGEATAPAVRAGDGLLVISGSGRTPVSVGFARIARAEGARVVALTTAPASDLAGLADLVVPIPTAGTRQFGGSLFEQAALLVLDAVAYELAGRRPGAHEQMLQRHTNLQ